MEIRALEEAWIQVKAPGDTILLAVVLNPGDSYLVPGRDGITLDTGNIGGLEIRLDGVLLPQLGSPGAIMRDVSLSPDDLLAR